MQRPRILYIGRRSRTIVSSSWTSCMNHPTPNQLTIDQLYSHLVTFLLLTIRPSLMSSRRWRLWVLFGVFTWLLIVEGDSLSRLKLPYRRVNESIGTDDYSMPME